MQQYTAPTMRTRSSRFFVILVHLLGVSNHHLPSWYYDLLTSTNPSDRASFYSGIRGVHPHSMELERLDLREVGGLDGVEWLSLHREQQQQQHHKDEGGMSTTRKGEVSSEQHEAGTSTSTNAPREPFWLQDTYDGKCLGPSGGFSECGDATLWFILRRGTQRKSLRMGPFGVEETLEQVNPDEPYRYALQIVDNDYEQQPRGNSKTLSEGKDPSLLAFVRRQHGHRQKQQQRDCLVPSGNRRKHQSLVAAASSSSLELGPCVRNTAAWSWRVDDEGILYLPQDATKSKKRECLQRTISSSAVLSSCQNHTEAADAHSQSPSQRQDDRLVQFSLVRYQAISSSTLVASTKPFNRVHSAARQVRPANEEKLRDQAMDKETVGSDGLPSNSDKAHSHASGRVGPSPLFEMNLAGRPLLSSIPTREARKASDKSPFAALKDTNPILFLGAGNGKNTKQLGRQSQSKGNNKPPGGGIHPNKNAVPTSPQTPGKLRKIEMNPYIAASSDEKWVDPQTGLEYHTDLCEYLGHDRKAYGRHTLVGMGLFTKTMLKIKVSLTFD